MMLLGGLLKRHSERSIAELMEKIKQYTAKLDEALKRELARYSWSSFYGPMVYAVEGGKRIRPLILTLAAESVGNEGEDPTLAAVAVELLHTESIIHDDIIDQETWRRERMAFHVRYGYNASVLTADFVFGMILDIASRYGDSDVARELSSAALRMCEGEFRELRIDTDTYKIGWDEYIWIISQKTASLFQISAKIGGILGRGCREEIEALSNYGLQLGIAYQIQDDILDWGEKKKIAEVIDAPPGCGDTLSYMKKMSKLYAEKAKSDLKILKDTVAKSYLLELADFTVSRRF